MHVNRRPGSALPLRAIFCPQSGHAVTALCDSVLVVTLSSSRRHKQVIFLVDKLPLVILSTLRAKGAAEPRLRALASVTQRDSVEMLSGSLS